MILPEVGRATRSPWAKSREAFAASFLCGGLRTVIFVSGHMPSLLTKAKPTWLSHRLTQLVTRPR